MATNPTKKQQVGRRSPRQDRARQTQLLIFEAAVRVLERDGLEGFNTNRIAEVAGFSVGTLYQYFADKQAILEALARYEQDRAMVELSELLQRERMATEEQGTRVRAVVRLSLHVFGGRHRVRKLLIERAMQLGHQTELDRPIMALAELLVSGTRLANGAPALDAVEAFVLTQSVVGAIRAALARDERMLRKSRFEDALVDLIGGFLQARALRLAGSAGKS